MQGGTIEYYEGEFKSGKYHGSGKYQFSNAATYKGEFFEGKKHGLGIMRDPSGNKYTGEWQDDFRKGVGVITFGNEKYMAQFENDTVVLKYADHELIDYRWLEL